MLVLVGAGLIGGGLGAGLAMVMGAGAPWVIAAYAAGGVIGFGLAALAVTLGAARRRYPAAGDPAPPQPDADKATVP